MSELSRHLKKKTVAAFLEKAEKCLLKTGDYLALVDGEGKELYRTGESITGVTGVTCAVLMVAGEPIGELRGGSHWSAKHLEFLRFGLQAMIDAEHTRRLIAEETLEQYRELSLLQRAAASLNDTLDPRLVARALLELLHESKEENHTVSACYACCGKKETVLLPLATLGEYDAMLNEIAESSLVNDIVAKGKAEIINHLAEDPRWQAGKTLYEHVLVAPIVASEATVGLLLLAKYTGGKEFQASDLKHVATLASIAAGSLRNAQLFEEVMAVKNYNESVLKSLSNGVIALDRQGLISKVNRAACQILHLTEFEIIGKALTDLLGKDNEWLTAAARNVLERGKAEIHLDRELYPLGQVAVDLNLTLEPLLDGAEHPIGTILVMEDITREKRIKNTMSRYMTDQVVNQLLSSDDSFLYGKEQQVSILFSDVRRFTNISENLSPVEAVEQLNEYFTGMVDIIFDKGGTLDKFIGDGIMALFGAPFVSDLDADNCVEAAIAMMQYVIKLNRYRVKHDLWPFHIGIGINTGLVIVGNIGSPKRMDFTVIGDHVNLASRLETANKFYGSKILISEYTCAKLTHSHAIRELDKVRVIGRKKPVRIFEVLDYQTDFPQIDFVLKCFAEGLADFRARCFTHAAKAFGEVVRIKPDDKPSVIYLQRCLEYGEREPSPDWDGIVDLVFK